MRRDDPLVLCVELHVQPDPDPAELQTAAAEARPTQARTSAFGEERPALNEHLPLVRLEDRDAIHRVVSLDDERREGFEWGDTASFIPCLSKQKVDYYLIFLLGGVS